MPPNEILTAAQRKAANLRGPLPPDHEVSPAAYAEMVKQLDELRLAFDLYFQGMERVPPEQQRQTLLARLRKAKDAPLKNTAQKFKFNQLWAKYQTYDQLW